MALDAGVAAAATKWPAHNIPTALLTPAIYQSLIIYIYIYTQAIFEY